MSGNRMMPNSLLEPTRASFARLVGSALRYASQAPLLIVTSENAVQIPVLETACRSP